MKVSVYNQKGESVGEIELNSKIFEVTPNTHLLAEAVRIQRSNSRQGTSNTKTRGEVRGGGITFGPRASQNWELKLNKKAKTKALFMSLSDKAKNGQFVIVDQIALEKPDRKSV